MHLARIRQKPVHMVTFSKRYDSECLVESDSNHCSAVDQKDPGAMQCRLVTLVQVNADKKYQFDECSQMIEYANPFVRENVKTQSPENTAQSR
jgi:hypothetical protein